MLKLENVGVSITGNSTNPTRFQHPVAGTYKKWCVENGKAYFSVASGGGTGRTLHPDNMAAGTSSYGMTDTMGLIGMGNNPMVGATVAVAAAVIVIPAKIAEVRESNERKRCQHACISKYAADLLTLTIIFTLINHQKSGFLMTFLLPVILTYHWK